MKWFWSNTTQVGFGEGAVIEHLNKFLPSGSKVLCVFGGGSIDKNGAREDVNKALTDNSYQHIWCGGIEPNPDYDTCLKILKQVREYKPDFLLAVGGGSVIDATKFISLAAMLDENVEPWDLLTRKITPTKAIPLGTILTLPATGSEWNNNLVISRRSIEAKQSIACQLSYPKFSLLDPRYTLTLPDRQLRNGIYDAMTHCIDLFLTGQSIPLNDNFIMSVMRELVDISKEIFKKPANIEMHGRLICAASFALNQVLYLGKQMCTGIHKIGHQLTVMYGIDHGASLAMVSPSFLRHFKKTRGYLMARCAERVFDIHDGTEEEKIDAFINHLEKWILEIGHVLTVSEYTHQKVGENDVEKATKLVMKSMGSKPFGWNQEVTEEIVHDVLTHVIV